MWPRDVLCYPLESRGSALPLGLITSVNAATHELGFMAKAMRHPGPVRENSWSHCPDRQEKSWGVDNPKNIITMGVTPQATFVVTWTEENVPECGGCSSKKVLCQTCHHHRPFLISSINLEEAVQIEYPWEGGIKDN